jgi:tetratricopeptide (TPR) repeat protein
VVALAVTMLWRGGAIRPTPPPEMANAGNAGGPAGSGGQPPDISTMTPEERFDRLWDRVVRAAEAGDSATVTQFSPMALGAYSMLPATNADLRFHAALIHLAIGEFPAALALADTILSQSPGHLFGYIVRGEAADRQNDLQQLNRSYRDFLSHYDAELRSGRPEYDGHKPLLDSFRTRANASAPRT